MMIAHRTYATPIATALSHQPMKMNQRARIRRLGPVERGGGVAQVGGPV